MEVDSLGQGDFPVKLESLYDRNNCLTRQKNTSGPREPRLIGFNIVASVVLSFIILSGSIRVRAPFRMW